MLNKKIGELGFLAGHWPLQQDLPTLVFIHSSGCNAQMWRKQVAGLGDAANTIALDLPGHGQSGGPGLDSMPAYAAVVAEFIKEIKVPRPVPCGLSIGSAIVLQLLLDYPDSVLAGILIGSGARLRVTHKIFELVDNDYPGLIEMMETTAFSPQADKDAIREISEIMLSCKPEVAAADFRACNNFDVMSRLKEIKHPVLIISGEDDMLTPPKYADYLEKNLHYAARCHLTGAGHMMPNEKPDEVNEAIRGFLEGRAYL